MPRKSFLKKCIKSIAVFISCLLLIITLSVGNKLSNHAKVNASTSDELYKELERLQQKLAEIKRQKQGVQNALNAEKNKQSSLTSQINSLSMEINQKELDISEKETDIEAKETETKILEEDITEARQQIEGIERDVKTLEITADNILKTIYIDTKTNSAIDILLSTDETKSFFSQLQYHTALGENDQSALAHLQEQKQTLEDKKQKTEDNKLEIEQLAEQIKIQKDLLEQDKEQLEAQKSQKSRLLQDSKIAAAYYGQQYANLSDDEKKKQAEMDFVLQQVVKSATKPKGYAVKGQIIATEGNRGCSTGPHTHFGMAVNVGSTIDVGDWVNPCSYLPYHEFWYGTCSGNGTIRYPYSDPFNSSRGFASYHMGIDLIAGSNKFVYAAHDGYYFEENAPCSNSWCSVGCKGPVNPCVKVCEDLSCSTGKVTIYCHVNFLN
jgi:peptidoglycan hydrolase CwlO-like protein